MARSSNMLNIAAGMNGSVARNRVSRRPVHTFYTQHHPFQIQPMMIAPVLPGETLNSLLLQARAVTDPINDPFMGWWHEFYFFYVKQRDLDGREDFTAMHLDRDYDLSAYDSAADPATYHGRTTIDWTKLCLARVVDQYFRNEGEAWNDFMIDGLPAASINSESWLNSAMNAADFVTDDVNVDLNADTDIMASEVSEAMRMYQWQRANNLTEMSYEDFLRSHGVRTPAAELHRPELVRYIRDWTYPTNTVDPATGTPASAVSWAIQERADKDRFISEPGFLFGVTVTRPKVYLSNQNGAAISMLNNALSWLPAIMAEDPYTSLKQFANTEGPVSGVADADGYWIDVRDLFLYGDQFLGSSVTGAFSSLNTVALPASTLQRRYPTLTDVEGLFKGETAVTQTVRQDGIVSLNIRGVQVDNTPRVPVNASI